MRTIRNRIDRFCYSHPRFGVQNLMVYIIIASVGVFLLTQMYRGTTPFYHYLSFNPYLIVFKGQVWRLITFPFINNDSSLFSLAFSMLFYFFIGRTLEQVWGKGKLTLYFLCGYVTMIVLGFVYGAARMGFTGLMDAHFLFMNMDIVCYSMFFAVAVNCPDIQLLVFFVIPIKIKWLALILAGIYAAEYALGFFYAPSFYYLIPVLVVVINFLIFCGGDLLDLIRPSRYRYTAQTINYKQAAKKARKENEGRNYSHKCAVCGRTDATNPELEFRYCSRCQGYHCFCQDHINSHIHFTE